jgi:putative hemolysin
VKGTVAGVEDRRVSRRSRQAPAGERRYSLRFATTREDVEDALRLRFEVFNLELHEGFAESFFTGMDEDEFDRVCEHLIITDEASGKVVGTYRLQTGDTAARSGLGFYGAREFDFKPYEPICKSLIELGRACIQEDHRTFMVISLLWKGIINYAVEKGARYLIGCSSLTSQDSRLGCAMFCHLSKAHLVAPELQTQPLPALAIPIDPTPRSCPPPPRLLRAYLSVGAKICGPPAIDREFGTIDFLTLLDMKNSPFVAQTHFLPKQ